MIALGIGICALVFFTPYLVWVAIIKSIENELNRKDD